MKKHIAVFILILLALLLCSGCSAERSGAERSSVTSLSQLEDKRIGTNIGTTQYDALVKLLPKAEYTYMESYVDLTVALRSGRIDAFSADEPIAEIMCRKNSDLCILEGSIGREDYAFMLAKGSDDLKARMDEIILRLRDDGTLDALWDKWLESEQPETLSADIPQSTNTPNGTLQVYAANDLEGFSFLNESGELAGYEIELISIIAREMGMDCCFTETDFSALIPGINCGKADVALGCISISDERSRNVLFTEPYHYGSAVIVTLADSADSGSEAGFLQALADNFRNTFITEGRWRLIVSGLISTLRITVLSLINGSFIAFLFSSALRSQRKNVHAIATALSTIMDAMPLTVLLLVLYYVVFAKIDISPFAVAIMGLSMDFGNSDAALLNTGLQSVDDGQRKAAASLGYSRFAIMHDIVFPQAAAQVFGQYKSTVMALVKNSAIVGYITVEDLTRVSDIIRCRTYEAFFPLIVTAVLYFLLARLLMLLLSLAGSRLNIDKRKNVLKGIDTARAEGSAAKLEQMHTNRDFQGKSILSLRHLYADHGDNAALQDINLEVCGGEVIAVLGPGGAGKTSLLYCLDRLSSIRSGEIYFAGENILDKHYNMKKFREKVGIVFQSFNLFEHKTVIENVMMAPMDVLGMDKQSAYELAISLLDTVGMAEAALSYPRSLTGGQRQRAAIARTLAMTPDVILLDEPTYALDPSMRGEVQSVIKKLAASGYTILLSTQDMNFARELAQRVLYMENGEICDDSPADEVFTNPANPKTRAFIKRMKSFHRVIDSRHFDFIGMTNDLTEFGRKLWWTQKQIYKINLIFEELIVQLLLPSLSENTPIDFSVNYTDSDRSTRLLFIYPGESLDPLSLCDDVAEALIRSSAVGIEHSCTDGENRLTVTL